MHGRRLPPARAARFAAWGNAFLAGLTSLDEAADRIRGVDAWHRVDGLRGGDDASLTVALGRLAGGGVTGLRLVLPVPGDVSELPGPLDFNVEALAVGEAVVCVGSEHGLLPTVVRTGLGEPRDGAGAFGVRWRLAATAPAPLSGPGLAEADRGLAEAIRAATAALSMLDVAGMRPETEQGLSEIRSAALDAPLPPGYPARASDLLGRACRIAAVVALAGEEEGTAVSATAMSARRQELVGLAAAARRAVVAAYNAPVEAAAAGASGRDVPPR